MSRTTTDVLDKAPFWTIDIGEKDVDVLTVDVSL